MLEDLVHTLEDMQQRWKNHGEHIGANELRTRVVLIDPVLKALGWDPSDPALVEIEPKVGSGWADYALLGSSGHRICFIEAKKAGDPKPATFQTASYTFAHNTTSAAKVNFCAWTNGVHWIVWDVAAQQEVVRVSIDDGTPAKSAFGLVSLWRGSFVDGALRTPVEPVLPCTSRRGENGKSVVPPNSPWIDLNSQELRTTNHPPPNSIRFPDGIEKDIKAWRNVFGESAAWLWKKGHLTRDLARKSFPKWFGEGATKFSGKPMTNLARTQGLPISYEGSMSAAESVKRAKKLLADSSVRDTVYLAVSPEND